MFLILVLLEHKINSVALLFFFFLCNSKCTFIITSLPALLVNINVVAAQVAALVVATISFIWLSYALVASCYIHVCLTFCACFPTRLLDCRQILDFS